MPGQLPPAQPPQSQSPSGAQQTTSQRPGAGGRAPESSELGGRWAAVGGQQGARRIDVSAAQLDFSWITADGGGEAQLSHAPDGALVKDGVRLTSCTYAMDSGLNEFRWADGELWVRGAASATRSTSLSVIPKNRGSDSTCA